MACPWLPICVATPAAAGRLGQLAALVQRVRQRLLAIDVLAGANRGHRGDGVNVVGRADRDRVDVLGLLVEHHAKILVAPRLGNAANEPAPRGVVDVAQGDDVGAVLGVRGDVAAAHAPGADPRHVDALARRHKAGAAQHVPGHDGEAQSRAGTGRQKRPTAAFGRPSLLLACVLHCRQPFAGETKSV